MVSRDADDHVKWLLEHGYFEKALAAAEEGNAKSELLEEVLRCTSLDSASLFLPISDIGSAFTPLKIWEFT